MTPSDNSTEWWSPQEAAEATGFNEETMRKWAREPSPRVRSQEATVGKQRRIRLHKDDVLREAAKSSPRASHQIVTRPRYLPDTEAPSSEATLRERVAVLEEVLRRQRLIDEYRKDIERSHAEIAEQFQEIEDLLLGPSWVPND